MRKNLFMLFVGFAVGAVVAGIVAVTVLAKEKYNYGKYHGEIMTKLAILESIPAALGDDYQMSDGYRTLFEVKDGALVIVERNGVRTLRVYRPTLSQGADGAANRGQPVGPEPNRTPPAAGSGG